MYENCARILTPDGKWSTSAPPHMLGASVLTHALLLILLVHLPVNRLTKPQPPGGMTFELQSPEMLCSVPDQQEIAEAPKVALLDIPTKATLANAIEARIDSLPRPQPEITQNRLKPTGTWKPPEISSSSPRKGPPVAARTVADHSRICSGVINTAPHAPNPPSFITAIDSSGAGTPAIGPKRSGARSPKRLQN